MYMLLHILPKCPYALVDIVRQTSVIGVIAVDS